jgi:hypothetical protein
MPMRTLLRSFVVAAVLAAAAPVTAGAEPRLEVLTYGLYETDKGRRVPMPKSVSGQMNLLGHVRHKQTTAEVFGRLGESFGLEYVITGIPAGALITVRTRHPLLTNPATGVAMDYGEREQEADPGERRYTGYTFDDTYEIAEGEWSIQFLYRGKVFHEQKFKVVVPVN